MNDHYQHTMADNSEQNSGEGVTPILVHGRDPCFQIDWVPILYLNTIGLATSFCKKICLSLSHLVPEILGPKVGLIFHHYVLFNRFEAFCINIPLIFNPIDPLFH